ncbi:nickel transporter [Streptomyces sp. NPDC088258]|uniref:HoxN/HupN/NixA family nickel/cobalt transporter n=1 Tax=Streptomyces sp. NPDC088258 TaxID=3365849 RepID=UPI0038053A6B
MNLRPLRRAVTVCGLAAIAATASAVAAPTASAHPLGNFTVNFHTGLTLRQGSVEAALVVDRAEIAAAQERVRVDRDADGTVDAAEARTHAREECATAAGRLRVEVAGRRLEWTATSSAFTYHPGEAGLTTSRLTCGLTSAADLRRPSRITVRTGYDSRRIGWQEITARGEGATLTDSDVPARSATDALRHYPTDPLADPLDQRSATVRTAPGWGAGAPAAPAALPGTGPFATVLDRVSGVFDSLVGSRELTVPVGLLALLLAVVLGASHAVLPGHGKTIMAAYLAGRRGTPRDAVTVGATVTLTHTAGVLVLGLLLPVATTLAGETVLTWLGLASGLLVTGIGLWLLYGAVRNRPTHGHSHGHGHDHHHDHHHHHHPHPHPHTPRPRSELRNSLPGRRRPVSATAPAADGSALAVLTDEHTHAPHTHAPHTHAPHTHHKAPAVTRGGLVGMGIAGGLVPSPSALVVLLGAVALGRTAFGVLLVVGYGLGMAATLTFAGLLLVRLRDRLDRTARAATTGSRWAGLRRWARIGPVVTSTLVLLVGVGLTLRAVAGPW